MSYGWQSLGRQIYNTLDVSGLSAVKTLTFWIGLLNVSVAVYSCRYGKIISTKAIIDQATGKCKGVVLVLCLVCLSICLSVCLPVCLSFWLFVCLSVCLFFWLFVSVCMYVCLSDCLSVSLPVYLSFWLFVCLPACPPACISVCLSGCLSVQRWVCSVGALNGVSLFLLLQASHG